MQMQGTRVDKYIFSLCVLDQFRKFPDKLISVEVFI